MTPLVSTGAGDVVLYLGGVVAALGTLAGGMWWLVWPRIEQGLRDLAAEVAGVGEQLTSDSPDTVRGHARLAAQAAAQLPLLRAELSQLAERQLELFAWRSETDRRLGSVEEALIALLGRELRNRVLADDTEPSPTEHLHVHLRDPMTPPPTTNEETGP